MQDLESSLNVLLRSDIARLNVINGDKLEALKAWLRVLVKYFPGRKPIRNYLKNLNDRLVNLNEITSDQWKSIVDEQKVTILKNIQPEINNIYDTITIEFKDKLLFAAHD